MKTISLWARLAAPALVGALLSGCAGMGAGHRHDAMYGGSAGTADGQAMCEHHKKMMSGKSPAERQAHMDDHMKSMSPEMRKRAQAMHERCT